MPEAVPADANILEGEVHSIVFANDAGTFTVARIRDAKEKIRTAVGSLGGIKPGEYIKMRGSWIVNPKYGSQFKVKSYVVQSPKTIAGLEKYLASGILPGVGPKTAERIVEKFGEGVLDVLDQDPEQLMQIEGIGAMRIRKIIASWKQRRFLHEVMVFLQSHDISPAYAARIYRAYGDQCVRILKSNPYRLAYDIAGIGFKKADVISLNLGYKRDSPERCEAAIVYLLRKFQDEGHVFYPREALLEEASELLQVEGEALQSGYRLAIENKRAAQETIRTTEPHDWYGDVVYSANSYQAEVGVAEELGALLQSEEPLHECNVEKALIWLQDRGGVDLGQDQRAALQNILTNRVNVLTGGPGTGKTTMIKALCRIADAKAWKVQLAAPTGRAAKRLAEATGKEAKTIHRLLEWKPHQKGFTRDHENPIEADWLIVDEASMVDIYLMHQLLRSLPKRVSIVLVGDIDQLPSVGCGNVLHDLIASGVIPVARLRQIYRQAQGSMIITNAHMIHAGEFPRLIQMDDDEENADFFFVKEDDPEKAKARILSLCKQELPSRFKLNAKQDIQVITPMHRGDVGSYSLNRALQSGLNPSGKFVKRGEQVFRVNDRVMQFRNNYNKEVFNGDIGQIQMIDEEEGEVGIQFDYNRVLYSIDELDEIDLAYAVSVHKSQGSEYPAIIVPMLTQHFIMLQRNLLYTAITRGKRLVVVVGSTKALAIAVRNNKIRQRYTHLADRLKKYSLF